MSKHFKKENIRTPVYGVENAPIRWEHVAGDGGVLALDEVKDAPLVALLEGYAAKRQGGVVKISLEIYEALKKNEVSVTSRRPSALNQIRSSPSPTQFNAQRVAAPPAGAVKQSNGIRIMEEPGPPSSIAEFRRTGLRSRPAGPVLPQ